MAFRFKKASCVVAGTFNMYIVQPAWLTNPKIGIFPKDTKFTIRTKFDEPGFRYQPQNSPTRWLVTPSRIEVEADKPDADCGGTVAQVLEKLPWTPLMAVGNNTLFEADLSELENLPDLRHFMPEPPEGFDMVQRSFHLGVKHGEQQYNLQLSITNDGVELSANVHTELGGKDPEYSQDAARNCFMHRRQAQLLIHKFFKASICYGDQDSQPP